MTTAADITSLFSATEDWGAPHCGQSKLSAADYLGGHMPDHAASRGQYSFLSDLDHPKNTGPFSEETGGLMDAFRDPGSLYGDLNEAQMALLSANAMASSHGKFTAMNEPTNSSYDKDTIAPLQTRVDSAFGSTPSYSTEDGALSATSSKLEFWGDMDVDGNPNKRRRNSLKVNSDGGSPKHSNGPGRRRKSEHVEPGSARAVYLEKNRQAASKCRSKQKMQQEELVETAREVERKNRVLKAEVEFLKGDMRDLMDVVGKHACCPDKRLHTYVQREADRLAAGYAGGAQSRANELLSPKGSSSPDSQQ